MRRKRLANIRLHQHGTQPLRGDPFSSLQPVESRYSIGRDKLIINHVIHDESAPCVFALQRQDLQRQDLQHQDLQHQDLQRQDLQRQDLQRHDQRLLPR